MISSNSPVAGAPVSSARPVTLAPDAPSMTTSLAHAVLVNEEIDHAMSLMLHYMSVGGFDSSPATELLKLKSLTAELSTGTKLVNGMIASEYTPMREVANKMG